jgi:hypothetical protein
MNQMQMYESLKTLPKEMLLRYAQNPMGGVPQYMAIAALQYQNEIENSKPMPPPQGTVKDEVIQKAVQPRMPMQAQLPPQPEQPQAQQPVMQAAHGGLAELHVPDHMFQEKHMAGGGIVAFDGGGEVPHFDGTDGSLVTDNMTQEQFLALPPETRARIVQSINDQRTIMKPFSAFNDFLGGPYNAAAAATTGIANAVGIPRLGRALGIYGPDVTRVEVPRVGTGTATPFYDKYRNDVTEKDYVASLPKTMGSEGMPYVSDKATRKALTAQNAEKLGITAPTTTPPAAGPKNRAPAGPAAPTTSDVSADATSDKYKIPGLGMTMDEYAGTEPTEQSAIDAVKNMNKAFGVNEGLYDTQRQRFKTQEEDLNKQKGLAGWMALAKAGFETAAGSSHSALQNIAAGGVKGLAEYNTTLDKLQDRKEKLDTAMFNLDDAQNKFRQTGSNAALTQLDQARKERNTAKREYIKTNAELGAKQAEIETTRRGQDLTYKATMDSHRAMLEQAKIYSQGGAKNTDRILDNLKDLNDPKKYENAMRDAALSNPSNNPIIAQKIADAKKVLAQRDQLIAMNKSLLPPELSGAGGGGGKQVVKMEDIYAAAKKYNRSVEQVKADTLAKGYVIQ